MTKEDIAEAYAAENHHILYDLDADADPGRFGFGPADDGIEHCIAPVRVVPEPTG